MAVEQRRDRVRVSVTDEGPGVPIDFRDKVFDKFAQADSSDTRKRGGTGLGLAISKQLVERMGGSIDFESIEGRGACFFFELPMVVDRNGCSESQPVEMSLASAPDRPRVLHVEDDSASHEILRANVGDGLDLDLVSTMADAMIRINHEHFDVVVVDLGLPDGSGWELVPEIRRCQPDARVVIMTATELPPSDAEKADAVLLKSTFSARALHEAFGCENDSNHEERTDEYIAAHSLCRR